MKLVVVIPAYNAARHIAGVLERVAKLRFCGLERVLVVDDGSRDATAQLVEQTSGFGSLVELVRRPKNGGYGAAMKDGLAEAVEMERSDDRDRH